MCSRVAGGDEPPSVLSDNLHNLILRMKAQPLRRGFFAVPVLPTDTPILQVAHELDVRLGWSPVVSSSLPRRWSRCHRTVTRYPHRGHVTGTGQVFRGPTKNIPARVGSCPPERPPVEARQTRICRASPSVIPPAPRPATSARPGQAGVQWNVSSCRSGRATGADGAGRRCRARSSTSACGG
jgi:hypothetical protein